MRTLFLTSSGLNEKTMVLFWKCIGKEPINTKAILVPSAAVGNDGAREGIIVCMERLMNMGIPMNNILIYNLAFLLSDGYKRTYSSYISDIPVDGIDKLDIEFLQPGGSHGTRARGIK